MDKAPADGGLGEIGQSVICGWLSKRVTCERRRCRSADAAACQRRRVVPCPSCPAPPRPASRPPVRRFVRPGVVNCVLRNGETTSSIVPGWQRLECAVGRSRVATWSSLVACS